MQNKKFIFGLY